MGEIRYYFSTESGEIYGPVTVAALRALYGDGAIHAGSLLRAEDQADWQAIDPEFFSTTAPVPQATAPTAPAAAEKLAQSEMFFEEPGFSGPAMAPAPEPELVFDEPPSVAVEEKVEPVAESAPFVPAVQSPRVHAEPAVVVEAPAAMTVEPPPLLPAEEPTLTVAEVPAVAVPESFAPPQRQSGSAGKANGMILTLAALAVVALLGGASYYFWSLFHSRPATQTQATQLAVAASDLQRKVKQEAQKQIKAKGYFDEDPAVAGRQLQQLKDKVGSGNAEETRISRDLLGVVSQLLEKTNYCAQLEKQCKFDTVSINGLGDLAERQLAINDLHTAQEDVVSFLQNIDARCHEVLARDHIDEPSITGAIVGFHRSGHIELYVALWQAAAKLSNDYIGRLDFLAKSWGSWSVRNGELVFPDDAALAEYNTHMSAINDDVKTIGALQKQIYK